MSAEATITWYGHGSWGYVSPGGLREELGKLGLGGVTVHDLEPGGSMPLAG